MRISQETIDNVRSRADVVEVIQDFVSLKKKGTNWTACCPFHNEKTPSFSVSPSKGIYKCFGCGKAGDAITFVQEIEGLSYPEAVLYLAKKYQISVDYLQGEPDLDKESQNERESIFIALNFALQFFQTQLTESEEGRSLGKTYFQERSFSEATLQHFQLGYSLSGWDSLYQAALAQGFTQDILLKAGLITVTEQGKVYDRFRERVMFPIHNLAGKAVGFGARLLTKQAKQAKYLNSPETPVYQKSKILYGLFQAKQAIRQQDVCYLVEGYTDVISLHQAGIENVVASSGTSLTTDQIRLVNRFTQHIVLLYDGDPAGIKASLRGTDMILAEGMQVEIVVFPDGDDPDSFIKKVGTNPFLEYVKQHAKDFIRFKTDFYLQEAQNDPVQKAQALKEVLQSVVQVPDTLRRSFFLKELSDSFGLEESILIDECNKILLQKHKQTTSPAQAIGLPENIETDESDPIADLWAEPEIISPQMVKERALIALLLLYADYDLEPDKKFCHYLFEEIADIHFTHPVYEQILEQYKLFLEKGIIATAQLLIEQTTNPELKEEIIHLITPKYKLSENWEKKHAILTTKDEDILHELAYKAILRLKLRYIRKLIQDNMQALANAQDNLELQDELLQQGMHLKTLEKEIAKLLGNVVMK